MRRWRILEWADRPERLKELEFDCLGCEGVALLRVGACTPAMAQLGQGLIADGPPPQGWMPTKIECPHCRRRFELDRSTV